MNTTTAAAFTALLATMTSAQRVAFLNMASMHIENEEIAVDSEDVDGSVLESEGHLCLVAMRDTTILDLG